MKHGSKIVIGISLATLVLPGAVLAHGMPVWAMKSASHGVRKMYIATTHNEASDANTIGKFNRNEKNKKLRKVTGTVSAISNDSITVTVKSGSSDANSNVNGAVNAPTTTSYTFAIDSSTLIIRKYKAKATVNEIAVGDMVRINATALTNGTAKMIWDKSIWWLGLTGTITNLSADHASFQLNITMRGVDYFVNIQDDAFTKVWMGTTAKSVTDLANGQKVVLRGSWNSVGKFFLAKVVSIK